MTLVTIGLMHPGEMGSAIGADLAGRGYPVLWSSKGRSLDTGKRAEQAGLRQASSLRQICRDAALIISICPPGAAEHIANQVAAKGFQGLYLDANGISPQTSRRIGAIVEAAGATYVDGCLIGPPLGNTLKTTLFLAGTAADAVGSYFGEGLLHVEILGSEPGKASALKMCDSVFNKGILALLYQSIVAAEKLGLRRELMALWSGNVGGAAQVSLADNRLSNSACKAGRFAEEMSQIVDAFAGLENGLAVHSQAAARLFHRLSDFKPGDPPPTEERLLQVLLDSD